MSVFNNNDTVLIAWRKGDANEPYISRSDTKKIVNSTIILEEVPDPFNKVSISGYYEIASGLPTSNQFIVNYQVGSITFNSSEEAKTVVANYMGRGIIQYPSSRIYLNDSSNLYTSTNVEDFTAEIMNKANSLQSQITSETQSRINSDTNHANSTQAHPAQNITYSGKVTGVTEVKGGLDKLNDRIDNIVSYSGSSNQEIVDSRPSVTGVTNATLKARLDSMENKIIAVPKVISTLKHGTQIISADQSSLVRIVGLYGRTLVNLLGRDGNCEDISKWTATNATIDSTVYKYGSKSIKGTANNNGGAYTWKDNIPLDATKYYIAIAEINISSYTSGGISLKATDGGAATNPVEKTANGALLNSWQVLYVKFTGKNSLRLYAGALGGTSVTTFNVDGVRLYEIDSTTYSKIDSDAEYTGDKLADKFPYVDSIEHIQQPIITKTGKNLLPDFSQWTLHANAVMTGPYSLTLNATAAAQTSQINGTKVIAGSQYTFSANIVGYYGITFHDVNGTQLSTTGWLNGNGNVSTTVTAPTNAIEVRVLLSNNTNSSGTFTFTNPQLEIGSSATAFEPQNIDVLMGVSLSDGVTPVTLASNMDGSVRDVLYTQDGKYFIEHRFATGVVL
jgi:hypothetical protein